MNEFAKNAGAWVQGNWYLVIGALVLVVGPVLMIRAWRRADKRRALSNARAAYDTHADHVGQRIEDVLTLAVASAAAYLSSTGLRKFGRESMQLHSPTDWLPFVSLDIAAIICGKRARRRARNGDGPGLSGALMWALIGVSAAFSGSEGVHLWEKVARAAWPLIAGILFELGSLEERRAQRDAQKRSAGEWIERKLDAVRMLHPIEWVRVQLALAADETISQAQATRLVRIERAGYRLYRLRLIKKAYDEHRWLRWFLASRLAHANRRAQITQARVKREDLEHVVEALQRRVRTLDIASQEYTTQQQAQKVLRTLIETRPGSAERTGPASNRTDSPTARTGTAEPEHTPVPASRTGAGAEPNRDPNRTEPAPRTDRPGSTNQPSADRRTARTGTAEPVRTEQVNTGTEGGTDTATNEDGGPSDEEIIERLQRALLPDGKFSLGGTTKIGRRFGIGSGRAGRLMKVARERDALGTADTTPKEKEDSTPDAASVIDLDQAVPVADLMTRGGPTKHELALAGPSADRAG